MFKTLADFFAVWKYESASTIKILELLTDESLAVAIYPEGRTLGRLANHLIETLTEMPKRMGLPLDEVYPAHTSVKELVEDYKKKSEEFVASINETWTDANLSELRDMYGEPWSVSSSLHSLILHQVHHRGQMTTMMRLLGLPVTGIYGPAREEWARMGMEPLP
ncbi:MAG: hypothetical protein NTX15_06925 [Candidatus Kapabacteria bacterium]|nr:hypothetical protein [Candidatus Kapabacteria bacterium]